MHYRPGTPVEIREGQMFRLFVGGNFIGGWTTLELAIARAVRLGITPLGGQCRVAHSDDFGCLEEGEWVCPCGDYTCSGCNIFGR